MVVKSSNRTRLRKMVCFEVMDYESGVIRGENKIRKVDNMLVYFWLHTTSVH